MYSKAQYRPPDSDSDNDSYEGFFFGGDLDKPKEKRPVYVNPEVDLYHAVVDGDLNTVGKEIKKLQYNVDKPLNTGGYTLLMHACAEGHLPIVHYLIDTLKANVNIQIDSVTPLMLACGCVKQKKELVEEIVLCLLAHDAVINVSDKYGVTPFMLACKNGLVNVVRETIATAAFEAVDNEGYTALHHAVEQNQPEIVKMLVAAGMNHERVNRRGYTPKRIAEYYGYYDLIQLLPKPNADDYILPTEYMSYNSLNCYVPQIFCKTEAPEYFPEICAILRGWNLGDCADYFAKANVPLKDFLVMTDEQLKEIGIEMPIYRMKILRGLLHFHLYNWSPKSIYACKDYEKSSFSDLLLTTANQMQNLTIILASLRYVKQNHLQQVCGEIAIKEVTSLQKHLKLYREKVQSLLKMTKYFASFSPEKSALYIDYDEFLAQRKRDKYKTYIKRTTLILGVSVLICMKWKNVFGF